MNFQRESLFDIIEEVEPLLEAHYEELTLHKDVVKLNPKWKDYAALEQMGRFAVFTAREDGVLHGYNAFFVNTSMHYADLCVGQNDVFFITPDHRRGTAALRFLRYTEEQLQLLGVRKVVYHCKYGNNFAPILHRLGYTDEEVMVGKII